MFGSAATPVRVGTPCLGPGTSLRALAWTGLVYELVISQFSTPQVLVLELSCDVLSAFEHSIFFAQIVRDFDDPNYLLFHDKAAQRAAEKIDMDEEKLKLKTKKKLKLELEVASQRHLIDELQVQVHEEGKIDNSYVRTRFN